MYSFQIFKLYFLLLYVASKINLQCRLNQKSNLTCVTSMLEKGTLLRLFIVFTNVNPWKLNSCLIILFKMLKFCNRVTLLTFTDYFAYLKFDIKYHNLRTFWHYVITCPRFEEVGVDIILSHFYQETCNS